MKQFGIIMSVEGKAAQVKVTRPASCRTCGMCGLGADPTRIVKARAEIQVAAGDWVVLEMEDSRVLKAAMIVYGVPVLGLIVGLLIGPPVARSLGLGISDTFAGVVSGAIWMGLAFLGVNRYDSAIAGSSFEPTITGIADPLNLDCESRPR